MGLFDSIRRVVGGGDGTAEPEDAATQPDLVDTRELDVAALRERAAGVAGEVAVLDFSLDSLAQFDDAIDAGYDEDLATADDSAIYATDTVRFGCYLGEVLVRAYDAEWTRNPDWGVTISGPDGTTTVAVFDVAERSITTGAVFAAVADRAAVEVGLDGAPGDGDAESGADGADTVSDAPSNAVTDDRADTGLALEESADSPDPVAADSTLTETDREPVDDDTESLIEEAEPVTAAGDTAAAGETDPSEEPATAAGTDEPERESERTTPETEGDISADSPSLFEDGTDSAEAADDEPTPADSPSLFDDASTGAGPTVADAPSAEDGPPAPAAGPERDGATADEGDTGGATADETDGDAPSEDPDTAAQDPTAGDGLRATYAEAADELVSFWTEYDLDYTAESLARLDALVTDEWDDDRFADADFGSDDTFDDRVFTSVSTELGSYFGEVLVRELDAEWSDETATDGVVVEGADGPLAIPVFKVAGTSITQEPVFARSYDSLLSDLESDA